MQPPCDVKALYEYKSEHEDDLNFDAGQVIHVHAEEDEEWLNGTYEDHAGKRHVGMFPKSFVELVHDTETSEKDIHQNLASSSIADQSSNPKAEEKSSASPQLQTSAQALPPALKMPAEQENITKQIPTEAASVTRSAEPISPITEGVRNIDLKASEEAQSTRSCLMYSSLNDADLVAPIDHLNPEHGTNAQTPQKNPPPAVVGHQEQETPPKAISAGQNDNRPSTEQRSNEKPVKSNAFRDRIAAFNKQEAAPIAPKPMAKPTFAKKPFVAPPPSKDSFMPPPTQAKPKPKPVRDDPVIEGEEVPEPVNSHDPESSKEIETPPKVGSLKDRIAALQAERNHQAARKANKDRSADSAIPADTNEAQSSITHTDTQTDSPEAMSVDNAAPQIHDVPRSSMPVELPYETPETFETTSARTPVMLQRQDTSRSIESIALERQRTGASVLSYSSNASTHSVPRNTDIVVPPVPTRHIQSERDIRSSDESQLTAETKQSVVPETNASTANTESAVVMNPESATSEANADEEEASEEEIDEEEQRKIALRERMAKMSGGMGMGMHMALGFGGNTSSRAKSTPKKYASHQADEEPRQAPIPMPGLPPVVPRRETSNSAENDARIMPEPVSTGALESQDSLIAAEPSSDVPSGLPSETHTLSTTREPIEQKDEDEDEGEEEGGEEQIDEIPANAFKASPSNFESNEHTRSTQAPPPIPSNRPSMGFGNNNNPPPPVPVSRPAVNIPSAVQSIPETPRAMTYSADPVPVQAPSGRSQQGEPPSRPSVDIPNRPPVPVAIPPQRPAPVSPVASPDSPAMTPGGTKRMSYFGISSSPPPPIPRQSIDSSLRESVEIPRPSFDTLSRTNSARLDAPARAPPPPGAPVTRAPPPPVPGFNPQPPSRAPTAPSRPPGPPPTQPAYSAADTFEYTPAPSLPTSAAQDLTPSRDAALENEKAGYEADDDDTDAASMSRPSVSGFDVRGGSMNTDGSPVSSSQPTLDRAQTMTKKKGIKGLFKRKEKDGKVI